MSKFYLTTPLYYVNDVPHIGHAYTTIAADTIARFHLQLNQEVYFLTGTDEHGQKIERAARDLNISVKELVDSRVEVFKELWKKCGINYTDFIRTTEERHKLGVIKLFNILLKKGDIYRGNYEGYYCVPCETFCSQEEVEERGGRCYSCGRPVEWIKEPCYFFKLTKYKKSILEFLEENFDSVLPKYRYNETLQQVKMPYQDLCISRSSFQWGIPVPGAEGEVLYVWFDALINYISAIGYGYNEELFWKFWPADLHIVGKDILKFHTLIWYSLLKAGDLPLPKVVFAHGWWKVEGKKISKSLGNIVDPNYLISRYTVDGLRYFLIREIPFGQDGDFRESAVKERLNADLANDLGNLFFRTTTLLNKYFQSRAPKQFKEGELYKFAQEIIPSFKTKMENIELHSALLKLWELVRQANKYIDKEAPWHKVKVNKREVEGVLGELIEVFRIISILLYPFLPSLSKDMITSIGLEEKELLSWNNLFIPNLESRNVVAKILFQKIE